MIANFLFFFYLVFMSCSLPLSIGLQSAYKANKSVWADSVIYIATRQTELICVDASCMPLGVSYGAGTSFAVDNIGGNTILMTAAHLCYPYRPAASQTSVMEGLATLETQFDMSIVIGETAIPIDNVLYVDEEKDICTFSIPLDIARGMRIAKKNPTYGEEVWSIGAPAGYFPESAKPITKGMFSGEAVRINKDNQKLEFFNFSMPTIGGMSGSPIVNSDGEVIGLVSAVNSSWHMVSFSPTLNQIREALDITIRKLNSEIDKKD